MIKYGIIYDAALFQRLERDLPKLLKRDPKTLADIIARCCEIKAEVVGQDETESGLRAILNAGHRRGATVPRCIGVSSKPQDFNVYCAKVLAGIGVLPDTITDRSIPIRLARKRRSEHVERFRSLDLARAHHASVR